jgi:hypothetical protein
MYRNGHGMQAIAKTLNGDDRYRKESKKYFKGRTPKGQIATISTPERQLLPPVYVLKRRFR